MNKKGIIGIASLITFPILILIGIVFLFIFGGAIFLAFNAFRFVGAVLLILVVVSFLTGAKIPKGVARLLIFAGIGLVLLSFISDTIGNLTLAAVVG